MRVSRYLRQGRFGRWSSSKFLFHCHSHAPFSRPPETARRRRPYPPPYPKSSVVRRVEKGTMYDDVSSDFQGLEGFNCAKEALARESPNSNSVHWRDLYNFPRIIKICFAVISHHRFVMVWGAGYLDFCGFAHVPCVVSSRGLRS